MAFQAAIVGLSKIGASIGLALADNAEKLQRVGHDKERRITSYAEKVGAVDRIEVLREGCGDIS